MTPFSGMISLTDVLIHDANNIAWEKNIKDLDRVESSLPFIGAA